MIVEQPKGRIVESHHVCDFHKRKPGKSYAGCTCSSAYVFVTDQESEDAAIDTARRWLAHTEPAA